jgi:hypothetical protein
MATRRYHKKRVVGRKSRKSQRVLKMKGGRLIRNNLTFNIRDYVDFDKCILDKDNINYLFGSLNGTIRAKQSELANLERPLYKIDINGNNMKWTIMASDSTQKLANVSIGIQNLASSINRKFSGFTKRFAQGPLLSTEQKDYPLETFKKNIIIMYGNANALDNSNKNIDLSSITSFPKDSITFTNTGITVDNTLKIPVTVTEEKYTVEDFKKNVVKFYLNMKD